MEMGRSRKTLAALFVFLFSALGMADAYADTYAWRSVPLQTLSLTYATKSIGISSDGTTIIVGKNLDGVYLSTNSGTSFTQVNPSTIPTSGVYFVAISSDGMKMMAASASAIYYSLDRGATWSSRTGVATSANRACISSDGSRWILLSSQGVYSSTDNGSTWPQLGGYGAANWQGCAMSSDATKIFLVSFGAAVRYSTNSGASWSTSSNTYSSAYDLASSSDGSRLVLVSRDMSTIYVSTNFGSTFTLKQTTTLQLIDIAISSDGLRIVVPRAGGRILTSIDGGENWITEDTSPNFAWAAVDVTGDGSKIFVGSQNGGQQYHFGIFPQPATISFQSISPSSSSLLFRRPYSITALTNTAGQVTFFANGKRIPRCIKVSTVSLVATCNYSPSIHGVVSITATISPTDNAYLVGNGQLLQTSAILRTNKR